MLMSAATVTAILALASPGAGMDRPSRRIPAVYEAGHFYAVPETVGGQTLRLLVDTGGGGGSGMYWITADAAKRLNLKTHSCKFEKFTLLVADPPTFKAGRGLPAPKDSPCGNAVMVQAVPSRGDDGQLGAGYLPGHIWTFDYPSQQLLAQPPSWRPTPTSHAAKLGLASGFARITIRVAGEPVEMLLDTGATAHPTPAGKEASRAPTVDGYGVTSYIDGSVFARWQKAHPDWRVVPNGDDLYGPALIEVPNVDVAGWSIGPIWFTVQSGIAAYMSRYTDKPINGALGGNVFRHFVLTVDYPHRTAYFQCAVGCKPTKKRPSDDKSK